MNSFEILPVSARPLMELTRNSAVTATNYSPGQLCRGGKTTYTHDCDRNQQRDGHPDREFGLFRLLYMFRMYTRLTLQLTSSSLGAASLFFRLTTCTREPHNPLLD